MASIYQRSGGIWWISYYPYPGAKPVQKSLETTDKTVAKFKKNEIENQLRLGKSPLPNLGVHIEKVFLEYQEHCKGIKGSNTISNDIGRIQKFIEWSKVQTVADINEAMVRDYLNQRIENEKISHITANHLITNLKTFINFAIKRNYAAENKLKSTKKYKIPKLPPKFLNKNEIKAILVACKGNPAGPMVATAIYTGMRLGELKRLTWEDINFNLNKVTVRIAKSGKFRTVPLHPELKQILQPLKGKGLCFSIVNLRRAFRRLCIQCGHTENTKTKSGPGRTKINITIGWHTFRHTFASHLAMNGVDLTTIKDLMGHADIATTMIYAHLLNTHVQESIKKLEF